jgi:hypothetical protein
VTDDSRYEDKYFELNSRSIIFGFADGSLKFYDVEKVEKNIIDNRILYTVLCANEAEGERFNFSFFYESTDKISVHFKNRPNATWEKEQTEISDRGINTNKAGIEKLLSIRMSQECCR